MIGIMVMEIEILICILRFSMYMDEKVFFFYIIHNISILHQIFI